MRRSRLLLLGIALLIVGFSGPSVKADDDDRRAPQAVTVTFGGGLNTAAPGNQLNHHVIPRVITVRTRLATSNRRAVPGVVNFLVSGFHQIFVYNPHITLQEVLNAANALPPPPTGLFVNYKVNPGTDLFYFGINPELYNPATSGPFVEAANPAGPLFNPTRGGDENRVESVGFTTPGLYLVICNVGPHLRDGMYAWVRVVANDNDWDGERRGDGDEHREHN